jgi:peptidyl-prolyl cis-trans isomerase A (cyclophilin A)
MLFTRFFGLSLLILTLPCLRQAAAQIYADVQVTGGVTGTFTIALEHQKAPGAVANFIGLATGERGWLDLTTGAIRHTPFYDGIIFHRVIAGFMNQTGSKAGDGSDGPGYTFRDEFDTTLRHDAAYTVSMANSGKQTNGSQFFITVAPTPWLNDVHTVFGHVSAGTAVIDAINATPTTGSTGVPADRPLTPISIRSISIRGPSLAGFDRDPAWLPKLRNAQPVLTRAGTTFALGYDRQPFSDYRGYHGADLSTWSSFYAAYFADAAPTADLNLTSTATGAAHFYRLARVDYATCAFPDLVGNTFHFGSPLSGTAVLNATRTGGTWTVDGGASSTLTVAIYTVQPYAPRLFLQLSNGYQFRLTLHRTSATAGSYVGKTNVGAYLSPSGSYTVAP